MGIEDSMDALPESFLDEVLRATLWSIVFLECIFLILY